MKIFDQIISRGVRVYIYDPTKNKENIPSNKIAEVEVEIIKREYRRNSEVDEIVVDNDLVETQEDKVIEEQEPLIVADEADMSEPDIETIDNKPAIETTDSEPASETTDETEETTFTVEIDLLASELTITESSGKKEKVNKRSNTHMLLVWKSNYLKLLSIELMDLMIRAQKFHSTLLVIIYLALMRIIRLKYF